ncbi:hypothetical protein [Effusibacillus dendaii]|uniref:Uncharacterized protein n=1 Tax=Effusibacillus dendaii TaxID=2743772 RepID=A0A7I8D9I0_9BACL|nr:hypothetical protein [Effusibacillus dendaii]BCJ86774.1 hypothetical protein skT53_17590 [Effusibacillus dendaii]
MLLASPSFPLILFTLLAVCLCGLLIGRLAAPFFPEKWARPRYLLPVAVLVAILHANLFHFMLHVGSAYTNHYFFFWWPLFQMICLRKQTLAKGTAPSGEYDGKQMSY